jgi:hypothetical protein
MFLFLLRRLAAALALQAAAFSLPVGPQTGFLSYDPKTCTAAALRPHPDVRWGRFFLTLEPLRIPRRPISVEP